ncbi:MAG TPA: UPF0182 family protein [Chloroflexia bacterium]|nr:UPF0182 family protein [Chloroflexia bacterium]
MRNFTPGTSSETNPDSLTEQSFNSTETERGSYTAGTPGYYKKSGRLSSRTRRRVLIWGTSFVLVALFFVVLPVLVNFWTDLMWFQEVNQTGVFWTRLGMPLLVFALAFAISAAVLLTNLLVIRRFGPPGPVINISAYNPLARLAGGAVRLLQLAFVLGALFISLVMAGIASSNWQNILAYFNAANWDEKETIFNRSISFYVFQAPFYGLLQTWLFWLIGFSLVGSLVIYFFRYSFSGQRFSLTPAIKTHISVLGMLFLGLCALGYQISNWNLVYSPRGRVFGASATDVDAQFPANTILTFIVAAAALLLLVNIFIRHTGRGQVILLTAGTVWLAAHFLVGVIYPSLYQNFAVKPNEITRETPYIANTIKMTREAFGLVLDKDLKVVPFQGTAQLTQKDIEQNPYIQENARLWDYNKLRGIYDVTQTLRQYYDFSDIDIDRYNLALTAGSPKETQIMLGTRELKQEGLSTKTWQSLHLQFTHGYGIQASPVNEVDTSGRPVNLITQGFPLNSDLLPVNQPRIYFGENNAEYSVLNTSLEEIDYPFQSQNAPEARFKYDGKGGIRLSNWLVKASFAMKLGDLNLLISDAVNDNSKILIRRTISERVETIAPFFTYDSDPYMVVANGRLYWFLDGYTTTKLFPHSDPVESEHSINYIRNSVKVVIDAYDGTTTFYLVDTPSIDPIAQTYANIYPGLFKPLNTMPAELRAHLRYPENLFRIQTQVYQTYHVTDPVTFYNNQDLWQIPNDPRPLEARSSSSGNQFEPYYLVTRLPGEQHNEFVLINIFQPQNRLNLVSWMAARMDGQDYGKLVVYNFDPSVNIDGPAQFFTKIQALPDFSRQQSLLNTGTSNLPAGPIIIIPVDNSVLYVMPYYLQGATTSLPQLQFIASGANGRVYVAQPVGEDSRTTLLATALSEVFSKGQQVNVTPGQGATGVNTPTPAAGQTPGAITSPTPGTTISPGQQASLTELSRSIRTHLDLASQAFAAGDVTRGNAEISAANADLARLNELIGR